MIIEDAEGFKTWLTATLEPRCDADPAALAKYVLALVRKDRPTPELRTCMIEQLDVFLQQETKSFVELLFAKLETQCFSKPAVSPTIKSASLAPLPNPAATKLPESFPTQPPLSELPLAYQPANGSVVKRKLEPEADREKDKAKYRRSRSRSWERSRRSRSRSRELRRDRSRAYRNKSPPIRPRGKRRTRSKSPGPMTAGRHSRSRSPNLGRRGRYRNRSPPAVSRSSSPAEAKADGTPTLDSNHGDVDMRLATTSQSIQSVISAAKQEPIKSLALPQAKRRCRDFDEKGYCMRGDLCPFDHGNDPVVLEDVALSSVLTFDQRPHAADRLPPPVNMEYNPSLPSMDTRMLWQPRPHMPGGYRLRGPPPPLPANHRPPFHPRFHRPPNHGRELISVPVQENYPTDNGRRVRPDYYDVFHRLGGRTANQKPLSQNCSLELKKVPRGLNSIAHLNNHFAKFGKIVNIQVSFGGDVEAALVTFSSHAEANAAYRSTEAVLNNRFIKVFWYNSTQQQTENKPVQPEPVPRQPVKQRLGQPVQRDNTQEPEEPEHLEKVVMANNTLTKTVYIPTQLNQKPEPTQQELAAAKANSLAAIKNSQNMLEARVTLKKMQMEKQKEALKLNVNLRQRKQELLTRQLAQQRLLIGRLDKMAGEPRDQLVKTIKTLQESIETLRKELSNQQTSKTSINRTSGSLKLEPVKKSKEEVERELLDLELEMMTAHGADTTQLQERLQQLQVLAGSKGGRGRGRGSMSFRGRGRGGMIAMNSVDHRTTKVLVSGYENDDKAEVIQHFSQYGELVNYLCDDATPSVILNYKTRKEAESALIKGRNFQDRLLSITWCNQPGQRGHMVSTIHRTLLNRSGDELETQQALEGAEELEEDESAGYNEDVLLQDDEEEEEDDEEKTWRR